MKYLIALLMLTMSFGAFALAQGQGQAQGQLQGQLQGQAQGQGQKQGQAAVGVGISGGNSQSLSVDGGSFEAANYDRLAPPVVAPDLTTGVCMGSASGGASGPGFGLSFGSTVEDEECQIRRNSILLNQLGMAEAAQKILCQIETVAQAMEATGSQLCKEPEDDNVADSDSKSNENDLAYNSAGFKVH